MSDSNTVLFGVHVPKCAGTTLLERVRSSIPDYQIYQNTSIARNFMEGKLEFTQLFKRDVLRFLFGHFLHQEMLKLIPGRVFLFTGLRHPVERVASEIRYTANLRKRQNLPPIDANELLKAVRNPMCWFFISRFPHFAGTEGTPAERAFRILKLFDICYFTETFERDALAIFEQLKISPPAESHNIGFGGEPPAIDIGEAKLKYDIELYDMAFKHFKDGGSGVAPEDKQALAAFREQDVLSDALNKFLYRECFLEYRNWGIIDQVIASRTAMIRDLSAEIDFYRTFRNNKSGPPGPAA